jgi:folate-binding Fe-S cluster repair protein YgfZ
MSTLELSTDESKALMDFLERYLVNLKIEIAKTDDREFRRALKRQEEVILLITGRLKET